MYKLELQLIHFYPDILKRQLRLECLRNAKCGSFFFKYIIRSNINVFGAYAMAGTGLHIKLGWICYLTGFKFSYALTTFVGQNMIAQEYERIKKGTYWNFDQLWDV